MRNYDFQRPLGEAILKARGRSGLTQRQVADAIESDQRTILNIENSKGNPKMEILYPLVRLLGIDPRDIFYPEREQEAVTVRQLKLLLSDCTEQEAQAILPAVKSILTAMRNARSVNFE